MRFVASDFLWVPCPIRNGRRTMVDQRLSGPYIWGRPKTAPNGLRLPTARSSPPAIFARSPVHAGGRFSGAWLMNLANSRGVGFKILVGERGRSTQGASFPSRWKYFPGVRDRDDRGLSDLAEADGSGDFMALAKTMEPLCDRLWLDGQGEWHARIADRGFFHKPRNRSPGPPFLRGRRNSGSQHGFPCRGGSASTPPPPPTQCRHCGSLGIPAHSPGVVSIGPTTRVWGLKAELPLETKSQKTTQQKRPAATIQHQGEGSFTNHQNPWAAKRERRPEILGPVEPRTFLAEASRPVSKLRAACDPPGGEAKARRWFGGRHRNDDGKTPNNAHTTPRWDMFI